MAKFGVQVENQAYRRFVVPQQAYRAGVIDVEGAQRRGQLCVPAAVDRRGAGRRRDQAQQAAQRRRLARAVGAKERGDDVRVDAEAQVVDRADIAVVLGEVGDSDSAAWSLSVQGSGCRGPRSAPVRRATNSGSSASACWRSRASTRHQMACPPARRRRRRMAPQGLGVASPRGECAAHSPGSWRWCRGRTAWSQRAVQHPWVIGGRPRTDPERRPAPRRTGGRRKHSDGLMSVTPWRAPLHVGGDAAASPATAAATSCGRRGSSSSPAAARP